MKSGNGNFNKFKYIVYLFVSILFVIMLLIVFFKTEGSSLEYTIEEQKITLGLIGDRCNEVLKIDYDKVMGDCTASVGDDDLYYVCTCTNELKEPDCDSYIYKNNSRIIDVNSSCEFKKQSYLMFLAFDEKETFTFEIPVVVS